MQPNVDFKYIAKYPLKHHKQDLYT